MTGEVSMSSSSVNSVFSRGSLDRAWKVGTALSADQESKSVARARTVGVTMTHLDCMESGEVLGDSSRTGLAHY